LIFCGACVGAAENENISPAQKELLKWHWKLGIGMYRIAFKKGCANAIMKIQMEEQLFFHQ
jgi:hypothetical protein